MTQKQKIIIISIAAVLGLGLAVFLNIMAAKLPQPQTSSSGLIAVSEEPFGGPFTLTDQDGMKVTQDDFKGEYRLIYFGFTYCPAICPTELAKITKSLNALGADGDAVQPIFITIDPERDTVEAMKNYVAMFHPRMVGLTGTPEEIKQVAKAYKIYYAKVQDESLSDYTMDHSSFIYFMGPDERLLHIFKMQDSADYMTSIMGKWLQEGHGGE